MNEFEWRRQLRDLRQPASPPEDLWLRIEQALDTPVGAAVDTTTEPVNLPAPATVMMPRRRPFRRWLAVGVAAMLLLAGSLSWRLQWNPSTQGALASHGSSTPAGSPWKPTDPRLSGAAIELDAARIELSQALQQSPHSAALQRLLDRTNQQQSRLRQLDHETG